MGWVGYILISCGLLSVYDLSRKYSVNNNSVMTVLFLATVFGLALVVLLLALCGTLRASVCGVSAEFKWLVLIKSALVSLTWIAMFYAMRELPISLAAPLRATAPLWTLFGAVVLFGEIPSWRRAIGIVFVFLGYWIFSVSGKLEGISFRRHKGIWCCFGSTILGACSALYDKYLLHERGFGSDAVQFWFAFFLVVIFAGVLVAQRSAGWNQTKFVWRWTIPVAGCVLILSDFVYFRAVSQPDAMISILSLIRRSGVVLTFVLGGAIFRERNLRAKGIAMAVTLAGVAVLCLAK